MSGGLLVIGAHPDDEVLLAGGTMAACAKLGVPTSVVCLTRGENGPIAEPGLATRRTLAAVRERELREACAELGVNFLRCYRRQDGNLRFSDGSRIADQLARIIDDRRPEVVISFGEDGLYWHDDHIATSRLTSRAIERSRHRAALYRSVWRRRDLRELMAELRRRGMPDDLWGLEAEDFGLEDHEIADPVMVDVSHFIAQKLRALRRHRTQLADGHALSALPDDLAERYLGWERFAPVPAGRPRPRLFKQLAGACVR